MEFNENINKFENILKIIIPRELFREDKLNIKIIYLNIKSPDIINICKKIEGNEVLTKNDRDTINNIIPYFFKKIGNIDKYLIRFIFKNISQDINLFHFKNILFNDLLRLNIITLNEAKKTGCILYSYKHNYNIQDYNDFINYLMFGNESITGLDIVNLLKKKNILNNELKNKSNKDILSYLELIEGINYMPYELLTRKKLIELFKTLPHIYGPRNFAVSKNTFMSGNVLKFNHYSYEGYNYDFFLDYENNDNYNKVIIKNYLNNNFTDKSIFNEINNEIIYDSINYNINSNNNTLYLYIIEDIKQLYNDINKINENFNNMILKMDDEVNIDNLDKYIINYSSLLTDDKKINAMIMESKCMDLKNITYNKFIYELYDIQLNYKLNLNILFQELISSKDIPIIYLVSGGEVKYYNIYRPLLTNINKQNVSIFINTKKDDIVFRLNESILSSEPNEKIKKLRYLKNLDYIKLKRQITDKEYINIYLFENGYIIGEVSNNKNYSISELISNISILNKIIGKIKNYFKLNEVPIPNVEKLIKFTSGEFIFNNMIESQINVSFDLTPKICYLYDRVNKHKITETYSEYYKNETYLERKKYINDYIYSHFEEYIKNNDNYQLIKSNIKDDINFIYKNQDYFYSESNIRRFIIRECTGKNLTQSFKTKLFENISYLFKISTNKAESMFKNIEKQITQTTKIDINYIVCSINFKRGIITFKNIVNKYQYLKIINDLNLMIKIILLNAIDKQTITKTEKENLKSLDISSLDSINEFSDLFDDINLGSDDFDDALDKLIKLENKEEIKTVKFNDDVKSIIKKGKNISINNYMIEMREKFDSELYNPIINGQRVDYKYGRSKCPNTKMRQPFIVTKDQLSEIDPESITGYMEYRGNYYICPRIWDATVNKPISVKKFIENGLKSPYSGSKAILESKNKKYISDEYGVIIRKPITDTQWEEKGKYPEWPDLLKGTEKEAYPGLTYSSDHPMKVCVPCCFINQPEDYNEEDKDIKQFEKPFGYQKCNYKPGEELKKELQVDKLTDETECKSEPYISNENTILKNCRLGLLPKNLDLLLNNNQHMFLNKTENGLKNDSGLFLRRGVVKNEKQNILNTMTNILGFTNVKNLINLIHNKLSPLDFIGLNNGTLIDIFCNGSLNLDIEKDKLTEFIKRNYKLLTYLSIDSEDAISNIKNNIVDNKINILYDIYSAWKNYINYIANDNEKKNIDYLLDLFIKPRDWLLKDGCNIIIFNKECNNLKCFDKFNNKTLYTIMLIEEEKNYFVPIVYIEYKFNKLLPAQHLIEINDKININNSMKLIKNKNRVINLVKLVYIQNSLCNYNLKLFNKKLFQFLKSRDLLVNKQYSGFGNKSGVVEYILLNDNIILPIYMNRYLYKTEICNYEEMHMDIKRFNFTIEKLLNYYDINITDETEDINKILYNSLFENFNYIINVVYIENINNIDYITGLKYINGLTISLYPSEINEKIKKKLNKLNIKYVNKKYPNILKKLLITNLLKDFDITKIYDNKNYVYNEINNVINIIKNQMSIYVSKKLNKYLGFITKIKEGHITFNEIYSLLNNIITQSKSLDINDFLNKILKQKLNELICNKENDLCISSQKLKIPTNIYNYIVYKIYKDIKNNKLEALLIFKGKFIYSNNINKNNIILSENELLFILTNNLISKYIKNYKYKIYDSLNKKTISDKELEFIKDIYIDNISEFKSIDMITQSLTSIKEIKSKRQIYTTVFNAQGLFNPKAKAGVCKFPYRNIEGEINYKCIDARKVFDKEKLKSNYLQGKDQICPITVDKNKKTKTFGYCPEINEQSFKRLNANYYVDTYEYEGKTLVKKNKCSFPFIYYNKKVVNPLTGEKPLIKVTFKCESGKLDEGSWCYSKENNNTDDIPLYIAAKNRKYIYEGKWTLDKFMKDGNIDQKNINYIYNKYGYKKGICTTKLDTFKQEQIESKLDLANVNKISYDEYNPYYCTMSQSKKGYSKKELYIFGKDELDINYLSMLNKNYKILNKSYLCKLFNNKIREIKKQKNKNVKKENKAVTLDTFYKLNPENCLNGPKKGGYKLNDLRDLLITYKGLNETEAYNMNKEELCKIIKPDLLDYKNIDNENIYPANKNINYCEKPVNRGGLKKKKLNEIAAKLNIDIQGKKKPVLCNLIREKIKDLKKHKTNNKKETNNNNSNDNNITNLLLTENKNNNNHFTENNLI